MSTKAKRPTYLIRVGLAHKRLFISAVLGLITAAGTARNIDHAYLIGWDVGVLIYLVAAAVVMTQCSSASAMQSNAAAQDEGAWAILVLTVAAGFASLSRFSPSSRLSSAPIRITGSTSRSPSAPWCCPGPSSTPSSPCTTPTSSMAPESTRTACTFPVTTAARLLGLRLFCLRHRHDVPGVGRRGHAQDRCAGSSWPTACCRFSSRPPWSR